MILTLVSFFDFYLRKIRYFFINSMYNSFGDMNTMYQIYCILIGIFTKYICMYLIE